MKELPNSPVTEHFKTRLIEGKFPGDPIIPKDNERKSTIQLIHSLRIVSAISTDTNSDR